MLMVESICGQGFTYTRKVEERRQKVVKLGLEKTTGETGARRLKTIFGHEAASFSHFYRRPARFLKPTFSVTQSLAAHRDRITSIYSLGACGMG
jgi:hypothetical protein